MRFVKASERLPEKDGSYCIKNTTTGHMRGIWYRIIGKSMLRTRKDDWEWLDEELPASIEDEAEGLYPYHPQNDEMYTDSMVTNIQRSAHITCARQYMGEIDRLKAESSKMSKALEKSVSVIKHWHGESAFDIYYECSPEMKLIRESLKAK